MLKSPFWTLTFPSRMAYYDKREDFNVDIINYPFIDEEVPCLPSFGVYIPQCILLRECVLI